MTAGSEPWAEALRGARILVTGAAGFIGYHMAERLLRAGLAVTGVDSVNAYYDPGLKEARLARLGRHEGFRFRRIDLADEAATAALFADLAPTHVVHLAAQAGVRHSIENPAAYGASNLTGVLAVLEGCRRAGTAHLLYASSSSVYGGNAKLPFAATDPVDHPVSLYAATKKAAEVMAHAYSHLYGLSATGLRFFTVYGPWGRPDMAYWTFAEAIVEGRPITLFNDGDMGRDFTYVDDVVEGMVRLLPRPAEPDPGFDRAAPRADTSWAPHRIYNIGNNAPERLTDFVAILERLIGRKAEIRHAPMQPGDVKETMADIAPLAAAVGFRPSTPLDEGLGRFVEWYLDWRAGRAA